MCEIHSCHGNSTGCPACKDNLFQQVSIHSRGDWGNTPSVNLVTRDSPVLQNTEGSPPQCIRKGGTCTVSAAAGRGWMTSQQVSWGCSHAAAGIFSVREGTGLGPAQLWPHCSFSWSQMQLKSCP